jgi:hypothetical protein
LVVILLSLNLMVWKQVRQTTVPNFKTIISNDFPFYP